MLVLLFAVLFFILLQRLFSLQIIHGQEYADNFNLSITRERTIKSTRGNIRDRNGQLLAYNQLSYSVTLEDNGTYDSTREQNLTLNYVAYELLKILQNNGESTDISFYIDIDDNGEYVFTASGFTLNRFKADVYGEAEIDALKDDQINATAQEMMDYMCGEDRFGLVNNENPYTSEELESHGLPESFTQEETLEITKIRYILSTNSFQKYIPVTIATNVSEETVAEVTERKDKLQGVDIAEDSIRVYDDAEYFANLIGYTGKASAEELEALKEERDDYSTDAIVGKSGVEQIMETNVIYANTTEDKESVANKIKNYGFLALPVVDLESRLVGIVTYDDAIDVISSESGEDMQIMAAITPSDAPYLKRSAISIYKSRIPWLLLLMISATFTGLIISSFESALAASVALTAFIPMLMDTGGNSGSQSSVTIIRGLSLGEIGFGDIFRVIWKEIRVSVLCAVTLAVAGFVKIVLVDMMLIKTSSLTLDKDSFLVAAVVCITLAVTVIVAKFIGCTLPIIARKIGFDPAVMASPFITTIVDAISLLLYFLFARTIIPGL